jgi:uncharacterized membrane protein YphA (DoxX/SURF4 family)
MDISNLQTTTDSRSVAGVRLMLGIIFLMTGAMKLLVPELGQAWHGQLIATHLPFTELTRWSVPFIEILLGVLLLVGLYARLAVVVVMGIMVVATYVHIVVDDPTLFPLQPTAPIIPAAVILMSLYVLWKGAGAWSADLKSLHSNSRGTT